MPIQYIEQVRKIYADQPPYQWSRYEDSPWAVVTKPVSRSRIALLSSSGLYHQSQPPFNNVKNDLTWRELPKTVNVRELRISHYSKNAKAVTDVNTVFPIERFRELETRGVIGELASPAFTFMGRIFSRTQLLKEMAPALASRLKAMMVDAAFLVPV
jgi:D-proline reductase (dithiol) PrdB